ncbi:MAG: nuclear transport factor 2 family protein [Gemmatimonadota bacterium]
MDTADVIQRFNRAFLERNALLLRPLIAPDCVMEASAPAPEGVRVVGREACPAFWEAMLNDPTKQFEPEDVLVESDRAVVRWGYRVRQGTGRLRAWREPHAHPQWAGGRGSGVQQDRGPLIDTRVKEESE